MVHIDSIFYYLARDDEPLPEEIAYQTAKEAEKMQSHAVARCRDVIVRKVGSIVSNANMRRETKYTFFKKVCQNIQYRTLLLELNLAHDYIRGRL